jgi:NAD(P)-dependent dehydrogenase (short-subunit alcohol dehydrogenase family)
MTSGSKGELRGRSAIVTGSTSGIGLGIARALAGEGANVMLNGFGNAGQVEQLRAGMAAEFDVAVAVNGADVSLPSRIHDMVDHATREFGTVDILVNNAGVQHTAPVEEFPVDTPLVQKQIDDLAARERLSAEEARARLLAEKQPSQEFATPEQIGALAAFLCSNAAAQIRGACVPVDGGWIAQ